MNSVPKFCGYCEFVEEFSPAKRLVPRRKAGPARETGRMPAKAAGLRRDSRHRVRLGYPKLPVTAWPPNSRQHAEDAGHRRGRRETAARLCFPEAAIPNRGWRRFPSILASSILRITFCVQDASKNRESRDKKHSAPASRLGQSRCTGTWKQPFSTDRRLIRVNQRRVKVESFRSAFSRHGGREKVPQASAGQAEKQQPDADLDRSVQ